MAYTIGARHTLTGSGTVAIAGPIGLKVALSSVPAYLGQLFTHPGEFFGLGHMAVGNSDGYLPALELRHTEQLFYPLADSLTLLGYDLVAGLTATVDELAAVNVLQMPYDRNLTQWVGGTTTQTQPGGTALVQAWTYTVPAGRKLWIAFAACAIWRTVVATTIGAPICGISINGVRTLKSELYLNTIGASDRSPAINGAVLKAGDIILAECANTDVGGTLRFEMKANGFTFDA